MLMMRRVVKINNSSELGEWEPVFNILMKRTFETYLANEIS